MVLKTWESTRQVWHLCTLLWLSENSEASSKWSACCPTKRHGELNRHGRIFILFICTGYWVALSWSWVRRDASRICRCCENGRHESRFRQHRCYTSYGCWRDRDVENGEEGLKQNILWAHFFVLSHIVYWSHFVTYRHRSHDRTKCTVLQRCFGTCSQLSSFFGSSTSTRHFRAIHNQCHYGKGSFSTSRRS